MTPSISKHYQEREPSSIRKAQILFNARKNSKDIDVINDEAILKNNNCVGYVTSGGYAHFIKKSIAMGYVPKELTIEGTNLQIEINGKKFEAYVTNKILYDSSGSKMRS